MSELMRARDAHAAGDLLGARDAYRRAIELGEGAGGAKLLLLEVLDQLRDTDAVLALADDLDGKGPIPSDGRVVVVHSAAISIARGRAKVDLEQYEDAAACARRAIAEIEANGGVVAGPGSLTVFDAWFLLAEALRATHDIPGAVAAYRKAAELSPSSAETHVRFAIALNASGDVAGAEAAVTRSIELDASDNDAHYNLACYRALLGKRELALAALAKAIELEPSNAELAADDADFRSLHDDPAFIALTR